MARLISFVESFSLGLNEKHIARAISLHVLRGYHTQTRKTRFNSALKCFKWFSRHGHAFSSKILKEVNNCNDANMFEGPKFPEKASMTMGYERIDDLIEQDESQGKTEFNMTSLVNECNLALACEKFSSIELGDSPLVELYNNVIEADVMHAAVEFSKQLDGWASISSNLSNAQSTYIDKVSTVADSLQVGNLAGEQNLSKPYSKECSATSGCLITDISSSSERPLDRSIRCLPGLTNKLYCRLENGGFYTVRKLLHHFPRTYADLRNPHDAIEDGQYLILAGKVLSSRARSVGSSLSFHEVIATCELAKDKQESDSKSGIRSSEDLKIIYLHLKRFYRGPRFVYKSFLKKIQSIYNEDDHVYVTGKVKKLPAEGHYEMSEYTVDMLEKEEEMDSQMDPRPYPLYPSEAGIKPSFLRDMILRSLKLIPANVDPLPHDILKEFNLLNLCDTYYGMHCPRSIDEAHAARRRLIFDEFFYLQLAKLYQMLEPLGTWGEKEGLLEKYRNETANNIAMEGWSDLTKKFLKALPYSLTPSQLNAVSEIIWDLKRPIPMNRLLQGEVGSGKTIVALLSCMEVIASGFQAAFMVPTELLAIQHYEHFLTYLDNMCEDQQKPSVALLTGSTSPRQSRAVCQGLLTGDISVVIGTHSLIAEKIEFRALRIAVIDEQHRFGVIQRGRFNSKLYSGLTSLNAANCGKSSSDKAHMAPHVLAMSATPIPRTLAFAIYGDMSLTQITGSLPGRLSIETYALEGNENGFKEVYEMMRKELIEGGKVYLVYPVIEESERLPQLHAAAKDFESISAKFKDYQCGLLHGRMKKDDKDEALRQFRSGNTKILLSTQVIEIGIDVPDASMMVVMNAERFGIAQLHQLRGRVGRGTKKSRCVFLSSTASALGRLKVLETSSDGFYLAKLDLMYRGPGDLLGKKQSGHLPEFPLARLEMDGDILQEAHDAALKVLGCSHNLEKFPRLKAELSMRQPLCLLGD